MTYIYIEPAREHRRAFARWCLDQKPKIQVASATGSNVPVDLYPSVPLALLEGSYVDGYRYVGTPAPAPAPASDPDPASGRRELTAEKLAPAAPRKRRPRKKAAASAASEAVDASGEG